MKSTKHSFVLRVGRAVACRSSAVAGATARSLGAAVVLLGLVCSVSFGQYLETSIYLPDSTNNVRTPDCIVYNSLNNTIYVACSFDNHVIPIDGATNQKLGTITLAPETGVAAMCYNSVNNKIYCAENILDTLSVIDGASNQVIARLSVRGHPQRLVYSPVANKVYCYSYDSGNIVVLDGATNAVRTTLHVGNLHRGMCVNTKQNKVYFCDFSSGLVTVVDGTGDSVVATIQADDFLEQACFNPSRNKVYVSCGMKNALLIIDAVADTALGYTKGSLESPDEVCFDETDDRVFAASQYGRIRAYDCGRDSAVGSLTFTGGLRSLYYVPTYGRVYCADRDTGRVVVLDASAMRVAARIPVGGIPMGFAWNPAQNRVYVPVAASTVAVIKDVVGVEEETPAAPMAAKYRPLFARGVLLLGAGEAGALLSASGREVARLEPGVNNVQRLPTGLYFIKRRGDNQTQKVVVVN